MAEPFVPPEEVGFVGLGNMGRPMAARLAAAGFRLHLHDRDPARAEGFAAAHGGSVAAGPADIARRVRVLVGMLPDGRAVREVVHEALAVPPAERRLEVVVDCSSSEPSGTRALAERLRGEGIALVDAPVSGGVPRAEAGTLAVMAGGDPEALARCRPLLESFAGRIFETGPAGSGHALKALNNMVSAAGLWVAAEMLLVAAKFGLDPAMAVDVLNASTGRNNSTENKFRQHILSRGFASGFSLDLMAKDLEAAAGLARRLQVDAPLSRLCAALWQEARAALPEGADHTEIVRHLEARSGIELEERGTAQGEERR